MSIGNQQSLRKYASPLFVSSATSDKDVPFSFRDWYNAYQGVIPGEEFKQYNEYLVNWYKNKSTEVTDTKLQIKLNYLALLKQLQLFFSKEETENWYNKVDVNNEKELLLALPYFAKKLKDISLYYLRLRENIKESRLKYNQVGTSSGIVQQIQKFLLTSYTQKPNLSISIPASIWKDVPELSAVKDTISVQIEELYDTKSYFDHSPTMPISAYYNTNDTELQNFLTTKGLALTSTDWIYKLGVFPLSADYLYLSGADLTELSNIFSEKFLGQDKFITQAPILSTRVDYFDIPISLGNNFFYWPTGVYRTKAKTNTLYTPVSVNESGLSTKATAGSSLEMADTVFLKTPRGVQGAWFRKNLYEYDTKTMQAILDANSKTVFRFPFPGYGLSAEDINWTGFGLTTDPRFFYLSDDLKASVERTYWSTSLELTAITPLQINNTTLAENKAYPSLDYNSADKIRVWNTPPDYNAPVYSGDVQEAWLYRMNSTDISVQLSSTSVIVWPYERIDPSGEFPSYYPNNISQVCLPIPVSAVNFTYSIAGNTLSSSDVIYKISNYQDTPNMAIECCWLSSGSVLFEDSKILANQQSSLQILASAGAHTYFVWDGNDLTDVQSVFKTLQHRPDCKFVTKRDATYLDFNLCTCKQVHFTPFGHPGERYTDYNGFTDYIIENNFSPYSLDLSIWRDSSGTTYTQSSAFCWYRTDSKIGWGNGRWYSGDLSGGNTFYLRKGRAYVYHRAAVTTLNKLDTVLPSYVLRYPYAQPRQTWIRAFKNENNEWISTDRPSSMILYPGNTLLYQRAGGTTYQLSGMALQKVNISENRGSIWSNFDYISLGANNQFILSYPTTVSSQTTVQTPPVNYNNFVSVFQWAVSAPGGGPVTFYRNSPSIVVTPTLSGLYTISVTGISATSVPPPLFAAGNTVGGVTFGYTTTGLFVFTRIPPITAIPNTILLPSLTSYNTPAAGYVINVPLNGWDYNLGVPNAFAIKQNAGARPYWAKAYLDKSQYTNYKGVESWGTPLRFVDKYNILSQPEISDITLNTSNHIEYTRNNPVDLIWNQPIDFTYTIDRDTWCGLEVDQANISNLQDQLANKKTDLLVRPTTATSTLQFETFVDNEPVEVYYNAINAFVWNITALPEISETFYTQPSTTAIITTDQPWANIPNQTFPTIAMFPAFDELYSTSEIGGFFTPGNIGISIYNNKNFTPVLNVSSAAITRYFEDSDARVNARGLTRQDQPAPYNLIENNIWLKEPTIAGPIAGTIKKSIFKKYQKFLPYQSGYESNPRIRIGLLTPTSRQTPWTGAEDLEWGDAQNKPVSFAGQLDVNAWANTQVLKQNKLQIDNWCTDVFGNQYGLYKSLTGVPVHNRKNISGEIWTRKNSQFVSPASVGLVGVFDTYTGTNLINELTGTGVRKIDIFFDTLMIETSGAIIFEKINYDFNADYIFSVADESRYLSLAQPVSANLDKEFANLDLSDFNFAKAGETWFFPQEKVVVVSVCGLSNNRLTPEIYQLDLNNQNFKKIFPTNSNDVSLLNSLTGLNVASIDSPTLSHNAFKKEYLLTILGKNNNNENTIIEIKIKDLTEKFIDKITVYTPNSRTAVLEPPLITQNLQTSLTITNLDFIDRFNFQCVVDNGPAIFEAISKPDWVNLTQNGLFTGTPPLKTADYLITFKVSNSVGPTYYSFIINITFIEILTIYYLYTEGYELLGGDGYVLQENDYFIVE